MRTLKSTLTALTLFCILAFTSCKKDNSTAPPPTTVSGSITSSLTDGGTWRVGSFIDSGTDKTNTFTDFKLSFDKNGGITATGPSTVFTGTWWTANEKDHLKLNLEFVDQGAFADLTHDWTVMQQGITQIQLMHVGAGDGKSVDFLTLNKNMIK